MNREGVIGVIIIHMIAAANFAYYAYAPIHWFNLGVGVYCFGIGNALAMIIAKEH